MRLFREKEKKDSKEKNSIKINYAFSLLFQLLTIVVPLITTPYLSRVLEPDGIGIYSFTNTNTSYFTMLGVLGLGTYGQLQIAKVKDDIERRSKLFYEIMITRLATHIVCIFAFVGLMLLSEKYKTMYAIQGILLIASAFDITWFFQGIEEFKNIAVRNIIIKLISVALIFAFVREKDDLYIYALLLSGSTLVSSFCFYPILKKRVCKVDFSTLHFVNHARGSLVFFIPTVAAVIMTSLDKTMIGLITHSEEENGYYAQAYKIETLCFSVFSSLNLVMRSRMAYLFHNGQKSVINSLLVKSLEFVSLLALPISLGTIAITNKFVPWFFGPGYEKVELLLPIFSMWLIFKAHSNCILEQCITASGRQRTANYIIWAGALFNVALNCFLIQLFQSIGAAWASLGAELVILILTLRATRELISIKQIIVFEKKHFIAAIMMGVLTYLVGIPLKTGIATTVIQIVVGASFYFIALYFMNDNTVKTITGHILGRKKSQTKV